MNRPAGHGSHKASRSTFSAGLVPTYRARSAATAAFSEPLVIPVRLRTPPLSGAGTVAADVGAHYTVRGETWSWRMC
jgi:hypothetical protein